MQPENIDRNGNVEQNDSDIGDLTISDEPSIPVQTPAPPPSTALSVNHDLLDNIGLTYNQIREKCGDLIDSFYYMGGTFYVFGDAYGGYNFGGVHDGSMPSGGDIAILFGGQADNLILNLNEPINVHDLSEIRGLTLIGVGFNEMDYSFDASFTCIGSNSQVFDVYFPYLENDNIITPESTVLISRINDAPINPPIATSPNNSAANACIECYRIADLCPGCGWCVNCDYFDRCFDCGRGYDCCLCPTHPLVGTWVEYSHGIEVSRLVFYRDGYRDFYLFGSLINESPYFIDGNTYTTLTFWEEITFVFEITGNTLTTTNIHNNNTMILTRLQ
jgi:hypothetical protein